MAEVACMVCIGGSNLPGVMDFHYHKWPVVQPRPFQPGTHVLYSEHFTDVLPGTKVTTNLHLGWFICVKQERPERSAYQPYLRESMSKPKGLTRCRETEVAAHVLATLPAFCGICGCTRTKLRSLRCTACLHMHLKLECYT